MRFISYVRGAGLLAAGGLAAIVVSGQVLAMSQQRIRPVVKLSCTVIAPQAEDLCHAVSQQLTKEAPTAVVRRVNGLEDGNALQVVLVAKSSGRNQMHGQLSWKIGNAAIHKGPEVKFDVLDDGNLSKATYNSFARGLIEASSELRQALRAAEDN